jgi:hypothetical protein
LASIGAVGTSLCDLGGRAGYEFAHIHADRFSDNIISNKISKNNTSICNTFAIDVIEG